MTRGCCQPLSSVLMELHGINLIRGNPSGRDIGSCHCMRCKGSTPCSENKVSRTWNRHSPPMSLVLSKQVGSSPSSTQHFREIRPLTPAPITATFFAMVSGRGSVNAASWGKRSESPDGGQVLDFKHNSSGKRRQEISKRLTG